MIAVDSGDGNLTPDAHTLRAVTPSRLYTYVRSRQLEGTFPGSPTTGTWVVTAMRVSKGWGAPSEHDWPYDDSRWPPPEPSGMDMLAKQRRTFVYGRARTLHDCRTLLTSGSPIVAAFDIDASWHTAESGRIDAPHSHRPDGRHAVQLVGYDDELEQLTFANSWGESWGDRGYGYLPYKYMSERLLEAWYLDVDRPRPPESRHARGNVVRRCAVKDAFDRVVHIVEVEDLDQDEMLGWALIVETESGLEVDDIFVRPAFRRRGHGRELANEIHSLCVDARAPLTCWISYADWEDAPSPAQTAILRRLGLRLGATTERWAAAVAHAE